MSLLVTITPGYGSRGRVCSGLTGLPRAPGRLGTRPGITPTCVGTGTKDLDPGSLGPSDHLDYRNLGPLAPIIGLCSWAAVGWSGPAQRADPCSELASEEGTSRGSALLAPGAISSPRSIPARERAADSLSTPPGSGLAAGRFGTCSDWLKRRTGYRSLRAREPRKSWKRRTRICPEEMPRPPPRPTCASSGVPTGLPDHRLAAGSFLSGKKSL